MKRPRILRRALRNTPRLAWATLAVSATLSIAPIFLTCDGAFAAQLGAVAVAVSLAIGFFSTPRAALDTNSYDDLIKRIQNPRNGETLAALHGAFVLTLTHARFVRRRANRTAVWRNSVFAAATAFGTLAWAFNESIVAYRTCGSAC